RPDPLVEEDAGDDRRGALEPLGHEERAAGRDDEQREQHGGDTPGWRRRQPSNLTSSPLRGWNSWYASSPRGSRAASATRIVPPWQTTSAGSSPARTSSKAAAVRAMCSVS